MSERWCAWYVAASGQIYMETSQTRRKKEKRKSEKTKKDLNEEEEERQPTVRLNPLLP